MLYKIISKTLALRLKPILSKVITQEQFGFLENRQIHDAVSLAQEMIHTIKLSKNPAFALKLDLSKAYDSLNWTFLRLVMIHIGLDLEIVN